MAKSANEKILDKIFVRTNDIARYDEHVQAEVVKILKKIETDLIADVAKIDPTGPKYLIHRQNRLNKLLKQARKTIADGNRSIKKYVDGEISNASVVEAEWTKDLLTGSFPAEVRPLIQTVGVSDNLLKELSKNPLIDGTPANNWWNGVFLKGDKEQALYENFRDSMRSGVFAGDSLPNLLKRIKNVNSPGYIGLETITKANAEALTRTSVQTVVNRAREATYEANSHLLKGLKWISTLDARTTIICAVRDNKLYTATTPHRPIGHFYVWGTGPGSIHWQCRSTSVPILRSADDLGLDDVSEKTRNSLTGEVPQDINFEDWLKTQDSVIQNSVLGETRAELWRNGQIKTFKSLVDQKGRPKSLKDLPKLKKEK